MTTKIVEQHVADALSGGLMFHQDMVALLRGMGKKAADAAAKCDKRGAVLSRGYWLNVCKSLNECASEIELHHTAV